MSTSPLSKICPRCQYDLAGLAGQVLRCPECGTLATAPIIDEHWQKRLSRRWCWFLCAPLLSLPGLLIYVVGQPLLCIALCGVFAYRAIELEDRLKGGTPGGAALYTIQAFLLGLAWAVTATIIMWIVFIFLVSLIVA